MTKISVCIATFNGEKYIHEQLRSIISQLSEIDEIIISDDSSTDGTLEIISSFNDKRISVYSNQRFGSPIFNFENALLHASGKYIFLSDQDDIWHKDKVFEMLAVLKTYDMVVCDCCIIDDGGKVLLGSYFEEAKSAPGAIKNLIRNSYFGCCLAFNRKVLSKALPFPKDIPMHDIWLGFISDVFFKSHFLRKQLTYYRKHSANVTTTASLSSNYSLIKKLKFRFNIVKYLPKLLFR